MGRAFASISLLSLVLACEGEKKPAPAPPVSAAPAASPTEERSAVVAYPPGMAPPDDAGTDAAPAEPKTGVCSFHESGYDGQDTKSDEKLIVKIKNDEVVAAEYVYRGSYAIDGKSDRLSIRLEPGKWSELELAMTTGTKKFKVLLKGDVLEIRGTAAPEPQGSCVFEKPAKDPKKKR